MNKEKIRRIVLFAILLAIETVFCFTILGQIPVGPIVMSLGMIPVIITSLILGKGLGSVMGFIAGLYSFIYFTFIAPGSITSFVFTPFVRGGAYQGNVFSLVICFVPRILTGFFPGLFYERMMIKHEKQQKLWLIIASLIGSFTNTVLVLGGILVFFKGQYEEALGASIYILLGTTILTNALPEAALSAISCPLVVIGYDAINRKR